MSIRPDFFYDELVSNGIDFFTGVPDSLLKNFCLCLDDKVGKNNHIIAANEGNAIGLAAGYYLGTGKVPLVYMQNSGIGNAFNPIISLCDNDVYSIPMLIVIGWRGEPGIKDEPQHLKQGKIQLPLLDCMDIDYCIIDKDTDNFNHVIKKLVKKATLNSKPVALLVRKKTFQKYDFVVENDISTSSLISREKALEVLLDFIPSDTVVVSTTGKTSREIFEIRDKINRNHKQDFLTVGSMGHASSIALGIAISNPDKKVVCIDGDGAFLMHLGNLSTISKINPNNFYHILINNQVHDSVGGQETSIKYLDIKNLVKSHNYNKVISVVNENEISSFIPEFLNCKGMNFLEIKVKPGSRKSLGRPTIKPKDNKIHFMNFIKE